MFISHSNKQKDMHKYEIVKTIKLEDVSYRTIYWKKIGLESHISHIKISNIGREEWNGGKFYS